MATLTGQCTVADITVKFPYAVQAEEGTDAALTALHLTKAATETDARELDLVAVVPGDLRDQLVAGELVHVSITMGKQAPPPPPAVPDGIGPAREQAGCEHGESGGRMPHDATLSAPFGRLSKNGSTASIKACG